MASVPENQKVSSVPKTIFNDVFAQTAASLSPRLHIWHPVPRRLVRFEQDPDSFFAIKPVAESTSIADLPTLTWGKSEEFILDFGIHIVGTKFSFHMEAKGVNIDAPCRLRLTFGESPFDVTESMTGVDTWISTSWLPDEIINVDFFPEDVVLLRRYSFRYVRVQVIDTSPKYRVSFSNFSVQAMSAVAPSTKIEMFEFTDPIFQAMDEISIFTLRDCMQTVFEDGPRRDRRLWIGDLRLQALTNYYTFKDYDLVKRCLFMFAAAPREDGSLPACVFEKPTPMPASDYIVDYDALFGPIVHDYVVASGDTEAGKTLWSTIQGSLKKALAHLDPETHTFDSSRTPAWKFLDWARDLDSNAGMHGLLLYCLKTVNKLAQILDIQPAPYTDVIEQMISAAASAFLSPSTSSTPNLFVSGSKAQISLASAAWLTLSGAFPASVCKTALLGALAHPDAVKPLTPYMYHHICEALAQCGAEDECVALMKRYWGGMVRAGADTFWECFDEGDARRSPYGDVRNNSWCHAWSCTPSYLLRRGGKEEGGV